jgi:hypothetical protein
MPPPPGLSLDMDASFEENEKSFDDVIDTIVSSWGDQEEKKLLFRTQLTQMYNNLLASRDTHKSEDFGELIETRVQRTVLSPFNSSDTTPEFYTMNAYKNEGILYKCYDFSMKPGAFIMFLSEVFMQKYAFKNLSKRCDIVIPAIHDYWLQTIDSDTNYDSKFIIKMQYLTGFRPLSYVNVNTSCMSVAKLINDINACLRRVLFFHNDYTLGNIMFSDGEKNKIGLIDFALSAFAPLDSFIGDENDENDNFYCVNGSLGHRSIGFGGKSQKRLHKKSTKKKRRRTKKSRQ